MKALESDVLKIMTAIDNKKRKQYILPDKRQKLASKEIADKFERFVMWLLSVKSMQTKMPLSDLYQYFCDEIDK